MVVLGVIISILQCDSAINSCLQHKFYTTTITIPHVLVMYNSAYNNYNVYCV